MANCYCEKCRKTMADDNFYTYKDGRKAEICKRCMTMHIDNYDPQTFLWLLEKMDVPYMEEEWNVLRDRAFAKNPEKMNGMTVFGKYLSKMRLKKWKDYGWADTEKLNQEKEALKQTAENRAAHIEDEQARKHELQAQLDNGEISEAQYLTLSDSDIQYQNYVEQNIQQVQATPGGNASGVGQNNYFKEDEFISEDELVDVGAELTHEDKVYLAMKWGRLYRASEWVELEKKYNEMKKSFDINDSDTESSLILICKTNLKMNQAIDQGDLEAYNKLSRAYETLRKSAKFTAVQNKDGNNSAVNSVGEMVAFCEKNGGKIPKFDLSIDRDIVDKVVRDMKEYTKSLIYDDPALARQIEDYIQKRENAESAKKDKEEARKHGLSEPLLSDNDHVKYKEFLNQQAALDKRIVYEPPKLDKLQKLDLGDDK